MDLAKKKQETIDVANRFFIFLSDENIGGVAVKGIRGEPAATILLGFLREVKQKNPDKLKFLYEELAPKIAGVYNETDVEEQEKLKIGLVTNYKSAFRDFADLDGLKEFGFIEILEKKGYEPVIFKIVQYLCWFISGWNQYL